MLEKVKSILINGALAVLVLVLFILGLIFTIFLVPILGLVALWDWIMRKLRNDPKIELSAYLDSNFDDDPGTFAEFNFAEKYFDKLTRKIADDTLAVIGKTTSKTSEWKNDETTKRRVIDITRNVHTENASVIFKLSILEWHHDNQENYYCLVEGYDDDFLINGIGADIEINGQMFYVAIADKSQAIEFCKGLLLGQSWFNKNTEQLWVKLEQHKAWMVGYKLDNFDYGFRRNKSIHRAHKHWL